MLHVAVALKLQYKVSSQRAVVEELELSVESRQRKKWEKKEEETVSIRRVPDHMSTSMIPLAASVQSQ